MIEPLIKFFDRMEDRIRGNLSHYPITYAIIGGIGVVLFWRGVWHTADYVSLYFLSQADVVSTTDFGNIWDGLISLVIGSALLLPTGLFVSFFIGDNIIIAGLKREKKLAEKTEFEIETEKEELDDVRGIIRKMASDVEEIKSKLAGK
ncbi:MAG: hypothetical protein AAB899_01765 [Patescibacteria group bacterium]